MNLSLIIPIRLSVCTSFGVKNYRLVSSPLSAAFRAHLYSSTSSRTTVRPNHLSKTQPKPQSGQLPPDRSNPTRRSGEQDPENTSRTRSLVRGPLRRFPGTWSMYHGPFILTRGQGAMATFANVKTSPHLGLNIKYGICPLSDGAA